MLLQWDVALYLVVSIQTQQGGCELSVALDDVMDLDVWHERGDVVVLDAAQLQVEQSLRYTWWVLEPLQSCLEQASPGLPLKTKTWLARTGFWIL